MFWLLIIFYTPFQIDGEGWCPLVIIKKLIERSPKTFTYNFCLWLYIKLRVGKMCLSYSIYYKPWNEKVEKLRWGGGKFWRTSVWLNLVGFQLDISSRSVDIHTQKSVRSFHDLLLYLRSIRVKGLLYQTYTEGF